MSIKIHLNYKHVMRGPTLRFNLTTSSSSSYNGSGVSEATADTFVIDDLARVSIKVRCEQAREHMIYMVATKHELAKYDFIGMNVTCDALKCSNKWSCIDFKSNWRNIGKMAGSELSNLSIYVSQVEIIINVYKMPKPEFRKLYDDCDLTDFILSTSKGDVAVHKACLAVCSPVFKAMFTGIWKEAKDNKVEIKDYSLQTVQHLKDFLYLGTLPDDGLRPLIALAALYSISELKKECARKLAETVQPEDLYSLHEFACANNIPELTYALSQLTPDRVINQCHIIQKKKDENQIKSNDEKQAEGQ